MRELKTRVCERSELEIPDMRVLLYAGVEREVASRLVSCLAENASTSTLEVHFSPEKFIPRLLKIPRDFHTVLVIAGKEELARLSGVWDHCLPAKLILILREWEDELLGVALRLSPSFMLSTGHELSEVGLVLAKIEMDRRKRCRAAVGGGPGIRWGTYAH